MTFWLNEEGTESSATFGGFPAGANSTEYTSNSLLLSQDSWWSLNLTGVYVNGTSVNTDTNAFAIADTGTSLLYMVDSAYNKFITFI